ncbi:MAG TPA: hypothetical protein VJL88_11275 [Nitrospira sp.]|nr:hypothetical protein [Nitrospira sp.]
MILTIALEVDGAEEAGFSASDPQAAIEAINAATKVVRRTVHRQWV